MTDGRRLIKVTWSDKELRPEYPASPINSDAVEGFEAIIPVKQWDEAGKLVPKNGSKPILRHAVLDEATTNGKFTMGATDREQTRTIEGECSELEFPAYEHVIPEYAIGEDAVEIGVNPKFLAEVAKVVEAAATDPDNRGIRLVVPIDPGRPVTIEGHTPEIDALAVLMPVNIQPSYFSFTQNSDGDENALQVAADAVRACRQFVDAYMLTAATGRDEALHEAWNSATTILTRVGVVDKADEEAPAEEVGSEALPEFPSEVGMEPVEETEETPGDGPTESEGVNH